MTSSLSEVLRDWEAVIGLEVHTALTALSTKLFCGCRISRDDPPNANVCPVCLGLPGALPVPNAEAVRATVMAGLATGCEISRRSMFWRKHYFYPDMAKNYQTTQGPVALCMRGRIDLEVAGEGALERPAGRGIEARADGSYVTPIRIQRIHLEEDAAKLVHVGGREGRIAGASASLIDYNRSGTPLIELVTEPDLRTPEEARRLMAWLRATFRALGISDCSLEQGSMRCDGNVSLRRRGSAELGVKTELKNLNSLKALHDALAYEICRQAVVLAEGGVVHQETRLWEPAQRRTRVMRTKETADDYRFFPDPDLAPFDLGADFVQACRARMPELPDARRERYQQEFGLRKREATLIADDPSLTAAFEAAMALVDGALAPLVANLTVNLLPAHPALTPAQLASAARLLAADDISFAQARELLCELEGSDGDLEALVDARGLRQSRDEGVLAAIVDEVLARCEEQVRQYRAGNVKVIGYLVGQCMRASGGSGNPKLFRQILSQRLDA